MNSSHSVHNLRPEIDNRQKTQKDKDFELQHWTDEDCDSLSFTKLAKVFKMSSFSIFKFSGQAANEKRVAIRCRQ